MIIILIKVLLRLADSFDIIFRQETSSTHSGSHRSEFQVLVWLLFIGRHFLPKADDQSFTFSFSTQKEQGILLFVH